jgi:hypothetical protein
LKLFLIGAQFFHFGSIFLGHAYKTVVF